MRSDERKNDGELKMSGIFASKNAIKAGNIKTCATTKSFEGISSTGSSKAYYEH